MKTNGFILASVILLAAVLGCNTQHKVQVEPVEIKPIHITIDVNVKVDRALNDFFNEIDQAEDKIDVKAGQSGAGASGEADTE